MGKIYSTHYLVPFYHSDVMGRMTIPSLLNVALHVSGEQSNLLGRGEAWTREHFDLFWVITEYDMKIHRLPKFLENLRVETEAMSYNKIFCYRDFRFFDEADELIVNIRSTWVLMDGSTRKIKKIQEEIVEPYEVSENKKMIRGHQFQSLEDMENQASPVEQRYRIRFSDIDMNQHVNNSKYYDWAVDPLGKDFLMTHEPKQIFIKYQHEVLYGEEVKSQLLQKDGFSYHSINSDKCQIEIEWQRNQE